MEIREVGNSFNMLMYVMPFLHSCKKYYIYTLDNFNRKPF